MCTSVHSLQVHLGPAKYLHEISRLGTAGTHTAIQKAAGGNKGKQCLSLAHRHFLLCVEGFPVTRPCQTQADEYCRARPKARAGCCSPAMRFGDSYLEFTCHFSHGLCDFETVCAS